MLGSFHRSSQKKNPRTLALGHRIAYYQRQLTGILTEQIITGLVGIVNGLTTFSKAIASASSGTCNPINNEVPGGQVTRQHGYD
jgi:hypothetical protein